MKSLHQLSQLSMFSMDHIELTAESRNKIDTTVLYSMNRDPNQNINHVTNRCIIATMAEQKVASHMLGYVMNGTVDFSDPLSYAYDVLSGIEYHGARIEVKTHQSNARWISVNLDERNTTGFMNLFHFLNYEAADYITIFNSLPLTTTSYNFKTAFVGTRADIKKVIRKSNYNGWYLHI